MTCSPPFSYVNYRVTAAMLTDTENPNYGGVFSFAAFPVLDPTIVPVSDQIRVYRNGLLQTYGSNYNLNLASPATYSVDFIDALVEGDFIQIQRDTEKCERLVDFVSTAILTEADLNLSSQQIFFLAQEAYDLAYDTIRIDSTGLRWDGRGREATNFSPASFPSSLVTLAQVQNLIGGLDTATISGCASWGFEGDGIIDTVPLDGAENIHVSSCQLIVTVDGVVLLPACDPNDENANAIPDSEELGTEYSVLGPSGDPPVPTPVESGCGQYHVEYIDGVPNVVFATPPADGAKVHIRMIQGMVAVSAAPASISGTSLVDYTTPLAKLRAVNAVGNARRFVAIRADGVCYARNVEVADLSDFTTSVRANRLDQMAAPTANVSFNSVQITGLAAGTTSTHAVNKGQMDSADTTTLNAAKAYTDGLVAGGSQRSGTYSGMWKYAPADAVPAYDSEANGSTWTIPNAYQNNWTCVMIQIYDDDASPAIGVPEIVQRTEWDIDTTYTFTAGGRTVSIKRTATNQIKMWISGLAAGQYHRVKFVYFFNAS